MAEGIIHCMFIHFWSIISNNYPREKHTPFIKIMKMRRFNRNKMLVDDDLPKSIKSTV